ncbi:rhomboid family protein [Calothrix sp. PCC 6303]|nr:rhomboid family protein [Calothrix sp. PCC 6303]
MLPVTDEMPSNSTGFITYVQIQLNLACVIVHKYDLKPILAVPKLLF